MKLLLDTCVWGGACQALEAAGHDYGDLLPAGATVTVESDRLRIRPPED